MSIKDEPPVFRVRIKEPTVWEKIQDKSRGLLLRYLESEEKRAAKKLNTIRRGRVCA